MYTVFITLFAFFIAIFILVAFHEYGHFKIARLCKVKVLKYCIGFGPALFTRKDKYGTEFILAPIPLGGYVKMLDEREGPISPEDQNVEFNNKKAWQKIAIVSAGPVFNFLLAVIVFYFMFLYGIQVERPVIQYVDPASRAAEAGMVANQEIVSIDNTPINSFSDLQLAIVKRLGTSGDINIKTTRFDYNKSSVPSKIDINTYKVNISNFHVDVNNEPASNGLGIWLLPKEGVPLLVDSILPDTNADVSNLQVGDLIIKYNHQLINNWDEFLGYVKDNPNTNLSVNVLRDGIEQQVFLKIGSKENEQSKIVGQLGIMFKYPLYFTKHSYGIFASLYQAILRTYEYTAQTFYMIYKLIVGELGMDTVRGPVMVAKAAGMQLQIGISHFLNFLGIVSIGLGVVNLLPIPVLDGGHIVYHLYELISGKKVSAAAERIAIVIGLIILLTIMVIAFYNDYIYW